MADYRYVHKYTGPWTKWQKKLEVIPAGTTDASLLEERELPPGCCVVEGIDEVEYSEPWPLGLQSIPVLKVFWDLDLIPAGVDYDALRTALLNPQKTFTHANYPGKTFYKGTIYKWYINFLGNEATEEGYRKIFTGMQKEGIEGDFDFEKNQITIEALDTLCEALTQLGLDFDWEYSTSLSVEKVYYDILYTGLYGGDNYAIAHAPLSYNNDEFWFLSLQEFWDNFHYVLTAVYREMTRDSAAVPVIGKPLTQYFRQDIDGSGALYQNSLAWEEIFIIHSVFSVLFVMDGLFCPNSETEGRKTNISLVKRYQCFWDFLADWYKESLTKTAIRWDSSGNPVINPIALYSTTSTVQLYRDKFIFASKPKIHKGELITNKVTASNLEIVDRDRPNHDAKDNGVRNKGELTLPIVFNNHPTACEYTMWEGAEITAHFGLKEALHLKIDVSGKYHISNFYFFTDAYWDALLTGPKALRVHEFCSTYLGQGINTDDLPGQAMVPFVLLPAYPNQGPDMPTETIKAMQITTGKTKIQADAGLKIFDSTTQTEIEIETFMNEGILLTGSTPLGWHWWYCEDKAFLFDMASINANLSQIPDEWFTTKKKLNDIDEKITLTLVSNPL